MSWIYPTTDTLAVASGQMGAVITKEPVLSFLVGAQPTKITVKGQPLLDVAYWVVGDQMMVSVASAKYTAITKALKITLPMVVVSIVSVPWGSTIVWALPTTTTLSVKGFAALDTSMIILQLG